eukprot:6660338-Prymnesium_polylepis.1
MTLSPLAPVHCRSCATTEFRVNVQEVEHLECGMQPTSPDPDEPDRWTNIETQMYSNAINRRKPRSSATDFDDALGRPRSRDDGAKRVLFLFSGAYSRPDSMVSFMRQRGLQVLIQ